MNRTHALYIMYRYSVHLYDVILVKGVLKSFEFQVRL